jgi:hypothetical protein
MINQHCGNVATTLGITKKVETRTLRRLFNVAGAQEKRSDNWANFLKVFVWLRQRFSTTFRLLARHCTEAKRAQGQRCEIIVKIIWRENTGKFLSGF